MRNALGVLALGGASWLWACAAPTETTTAALELHALPSCELPGADRVAVRASGDFATRAHDFPAQAAFDYDSFPSDTRFLAFEVGREDARAGGLLALSGADVRRALWMLPFGRSCPLGDPLAVAADGAALAPLADGGLLIAGGRDENGIAVSNALVLAPGAPLATEVEGGMLLRRAYASATPVAGGVLVVGGADDETYELFDAELGRFDMAHASKLASGPRRDHGAVALDTERVLVAGGVTEFGAEPLRSAEVIDVASGAPHRTRGDLNVGRAHPTLLALDSGQVLVALGASDSGGDGVPPVREVERFDVERETFQVVASLPDDHLYAAVAALEGERVVYVGCDADADAACQIALLVPDGEGFALVMPDFEAASTDPAPMRGLSQLRLLALHDGRLLVTGRASAGTSRRAFIIDFNNLAIESDVDLSRVPAVLLELADGSRVEADAAGISLARQDAQSILDDAPSALIARGATVLALGAKERWQLDEKGLTALSAARADLPHLRFADVRIEITWTGDAALLLEADRAAPTSIELSAGEIALGDCRLAHTAGAAVTIERRGDRVSLQSGADTQRCSASALGERIGIALRAEQGAAFTRLRVKRL